MLLPWVSLRVWKAATAHDRVWHRGHAFADLPPIGYCTKYGVISTILIVNLRNYDPNCRQNGWQ